MDLITCYTMFGVRLEHFTAFDIIIVVVIDHVNNYFLFFHHHLDYHQIEIIIIIINGHYHQLYGPYYLLHHVWSQVGTLYCF